jgi:integral membrane protein (TIGR01906 family)
MKAGRRTGPLFDPGDDYILWQRGGKVNQTWVRIAQWLAILAMPFFLGLNTITLMVSDFYPRYEYGKASFPADPFGLTQEERLELALVAVEYLERKEPAEEVIFMLEEQRLPGTGDPLYNEEEIGHMVDVKRLTDTIRRVGRGAALLVASGLVVLLVRRATRPAAYEAIKRGGLLTAGMLLLIALFILLAWSVFFVFFHELLFPPGTWTFAYSDSLIRLFPEKFWFDFGVLLSVGTLLEGALVALIGALLGRQAR